MNPEKSAPPNGPLAKPREKESNARTSAASGQGMLASSLANSSGDRGGSNWSVVDRPSLSTTLVPHACRTISRGVMVAFRSEPPQTCFGPRYFGCYESHTGGRSEPTTPKMRLEETLALTPALSPRRGGSTHRTREFSRPLVWRCFCLATVLLIDMASAQNLLPNPGFEEGREAPTGWRQVGASGRRIENARNALMVQGGGNDASYWQAEEAALQPGGLYRLSFFA